MTAARSPGPAPLSGAFRRATERIRPWRAPDPAAGGSVVGIVGAGAAGLATAALLQRRGNHPVLFDAREHAGGSWAGRYESLRLNTVRWMSDLPGLRMAREAGRWPSRDHMVAYLLAYADWHRLDVRLGMAVSTIEAMDAGWRLVFADGAATEVDAVVVATGHSRAPSMPDWAGADLFGGSLMHSSGYVRPSETLGRRILVVGGGSSGGEIVVDLVGAGREVVWSIRSAPHVFPREALGIPTTPFAAIGDMMPDALVDFSSWLAERMIYGRRDYLPAPERRLTERLADCKEPMIADGITELIRAGRVEVVGPVEDLTTDGARLEGGELVRVDTVIAATGYGPALDGLVGHLGVLDDAGLPSAIDPLPGLGFVGYRIPLAGTLWAVDQDAHRLAGSSAIVPSEGRSRR